MSTLRNRQNARVEVKNIGGIDRLEVELEAGINCLVGRNATNRTSLLQSLMGALGSDDVSLKGDADEGEVTLQIGGNTYTRHLIRRDGTVVTEGDPYLDDPMLGDLFAFLIETNEARQAVSRGDDLHEIIMRPVDTEQIDTEIEQLESEKRRVDEQLEELESLGEELPRLKKERTKLENEIDEKRVNLEEIETEIEETDADLEETREEKSEAESKLEELREARRNLEEVHHQLETERESLAALREDRESIEAKLENLEEPVSGEIKDLSARAEQLRDRKQAVSAEINELHSIIQFNEEMLSDSNGELASILPDNDGNDLTNQLVDDSTVCWTCGTRVGASQIEETIDRLRNLVQQKQKERNEIDAELSEINKEQSELEERRRQRAQFRSQIDTIHEEVEEREQRIDRLTEQREELESTVEGLEEDVQEFESEDYNEIVELHSEANQLEFEISKLEDNLEDVETEIARVESELDQQEELEVRREEIRRELEQLRTKIERIESDAVEQFNAHMESVLDLLEYKNLDRIWIERVEQESAQGRRSTAESVFDLHVVRTSESGTTYEDTIDHLSESERKVTGLVFALAGYLVHDVHETVPFILLDSLEALDSERIADLVEYVAEYSPYVVVALLPEDAGALEGARKITPS